MIKPASAYFQRFAWGVHVYGTQDTFGQPPNNFTSGGNLWGFMDTPSASQQPFLDNLTDQQIAVIRVRNFVGVKMNDTLTESRFGEVWTVLSASRDVPALETVCECRRQRPSPVSG